MTREELEMRKLVRESDVIDKTDESELAKAFNHLWDKYIEQEPTLDKIRAEIESIERYGTNNGHDIWLRTPEEIIKEALIIIDKYKTESENLEPNPNINVIGPAGRGHNFKMKDYLQN